jgi:hypothetical protein
MTNIIETQLTEDDFFIGPIDKRALEMNKKSEIYLCYDYRLRAKELFDNQEKAIKYCKENYCDYSIYPIGTFCPAYNRY